MFQTTVVQERRRRQRSHEAGGRGQPRLRAGPRAAELAVAFSVQQARGAGSEVQPEHIARLDDEPDVQFSGRLQQPRQEQAVHIEIVGAVHEVIIRYKRASVITRRTACSKKKIKKTTTVVVLFLCCHRTRFHLNVFDFIVGPRQDKPWWSTEPKKCPCGKTYREKKNETKQKSAKQNDL